MSKAAVSAQALRTPDITGSIRMECLSNVSDLVRVEVWVSPLLFLSQEQLRRMQEETDTFVRRLWLELADTPCGR